MTILAAMQSAAVRLIGKKPVTFFSSQGTFEMEMVELVNDLASDIFGAHDWQALTKFATITGDGTTTSFAKPADFDRMAVGSSVSDLNTWFWNYTNISDLNDWVQIQNGRYLAIQPGWWVILSDEFQFYPAPADGRVAKYPYISKYYARANDNSLKESFTTDSDSFVLDERLLTLGLLWKWRDMKKLDTSSEQQAFEFAFSEAAGRDHGSRVIRKGSRVFGNVPTGWPWELGT